MLNSKEDIGKLDRRITFQEKIIGTNASNEDEETGWQNIATNPTVWARKDERIGNESYRADKLVDHHTILFTCRYRSDITAVMRVVYEDRAYNIVAPPVEIARRRYLTVECESGGDFVGTVGVSGAYSSSFSSAYDT